MKLPAIPRWDNIAAPDLTNSLRMFREGMSGIGGMIDNQLTRNQKVVDEQDATNLYNFKAAIGNLSDMPDNLNTLIRSGQGLEMAKLMGVRPDQAMGYLDADKLVPEARTRQTQNEAYDEARQLREVLPMLQQMENTVRSGTSAAELEPGFQALVDTGTLSTDMVNKLRKASFVADDQRLAQLDAATNRQITKENQLDAERRRTEERRAADETAKLRQEIDVARAAMQPIVAGLPADANQGEFLFNLRSHLRGLPGTSVKAADAVVDELTQQFKTALPALGPAEQQKEAAITKQNEEAIKNYENVVRVAERSRDAELTGLGLTGGEATSIAGEALIEKALASIGLPATTPPGDGPGDRLGNIKATIATYYETLPAAVIAKAIRQASPDRGWWSSDTDRAKNIKEILDKELLKPETEANMRKIKQINERVLEAQRKLAEQEFVLYGAQAPKK
jgi:hypothetical protein